MARYLSMAQAAAYLNVPYNTLRHWRTYGQGPLGFRVGRHVMYLPEDLDAWMLARRADELARQAV